MLVLLSFSVSPHSKLYYSEPLTFRQTTLPSFMRVIFGLLNRDGSNPRRLTSSPVAESDPVFSPDGSQYRVCG